MGKRDKQKQKHERGQRSFNYLQEQDYIDDTAPPSHSSSTLPPSDEELEKELEVGEDATQEEEPKNHDDDNLNMPSKFLLYQQSVQVSLPLIFKKKKNSCFLDLIEKFIMWLF